MSQAQGRLPRLDLSLSARFELSMVEDRDDSVGRGTDVIRALDPTKHYDKLDRNRGFDGVRALETLPFRSSQVSTSTRTVDS